MLIYLQIRQDVVLQAEQYVGVSRAGLLNSALSSVLQMEEGSIVIIIGAVWVGETA
jgi:hypothetical protein